MFQPVSDTRNALLDGALECFAHYGFEGASIRMIADRAGRPISLISHHFGSKEGLYIEVFRRMLKSFQERYAAIPELQREAPSTRESALASLGDLVHFLYLDSAIKQRNQDPALECGAVLWLREYRSPRPLLRELIRAYLDPLTERLRACVTLICPDLDPAQVRFLCISILGMINGHSMMLGLNEALWGAEDSLIDPRERADQLVGLCLRGLEAARRA
ncbi:MAG: hypothetical protein H6Q00_2451 [Holophagaceae bacterium]|nr:hypothetical protein [Holophagaceae bacterium]